MKQIGDMKLFSVEDLARELDIQPYTIRRLLHSGKLRGRKMARKWYVTEESLKEYFSQPEAIKDEPARPSAGGRK